MKSPVFATLFVVLAALASPVLAAPVTETIVMIRHGEKPDGGLGRLNCRGLERAQALPPVLARQFGRFGAIFAPDPDKLKKDDGVKYRYQRPLQTVTPLSKATGVPVDTRFGYKQIDELGTELELPKYSAATVLVAWEHKKLAELARDLLEKYGADPDQVPRWKGSDFDGIFILKLTRDGKAVKAGFALGRQDLDGRLAPCKDM